MNIEHNVSLKPYNTFHVECIADSFASVLSLSDLITVWKSPERKNANQKLFLGCGSNILFTEDTFHGMVVHNNIVGKEVVSNTDKEVFLKVGGGENRNDFIQWTIEQDLYGLENLISIPGNVACAPVQNIGAYGMDVSHAIVSVGYMNAKIGVYETLSHKDCNFGYRDSVFKHDLQGDAFITDVTFRLYHYDPDTYAPIVQYGAVAEELQKHHITKPKPADIAKTIAGIRASKLPDRHNVGTAGSFFKNIVLSKDEYKTFLAKVQALKPGLVPESFPIGEDYFKIPTGRILDHVLGYRGHRDGNVGCRENQALCIVNYGGATGKDVVLFAQKLQQECHEKLGITIEPEVNFIQ